MAYIQVKSSNPKFSYIIKKNPQSGMALKSIRLGTGAGYFSKDDESTYNIFFHDSPTEISYPEYKDQSFEYINTTRYSSSLFVLNAIYDFLRDTVKSLQEDDISDVYENTVICNMIPMQGAKMLSAFVRHFPDYEIVLENVTGKHYRATFKTKKSLFCLLNLVSLFMVFNAIRNKQEYIAIDENVAEKYLKAAQILDAPYFIKYNFKVFILRSPVLFDKYKHILEYSPTQKLNFLFGDTNKMRLDFAKTHLLPRASRQKGVVDIGCGEGYYLFNLSKKMEYESYHAIDIDEEVLHTVSRKAKFRKMDNVATYKSFDSFLESYDKDVPLNFICMEVIEHMSKDEATELICKCVRHPQFKSIVLTTPNKDFNSLYFDDEDKDDNLRHMDHKFEFTKEEFKEWVLTLVFSLVYPKDPKDICDIKYDIFDVGDIVDEKPVSLGLVMWHQPKAATEYEEVWDEWLKTHPKCVEPDCENKRIRYSVFCSEHTHEILSNQIKEDINENNENK